MKYSVIIQPSAAAQIDAAFVYLAANASTEIAVRWFNKLEARLDTLSRLPRRCPIAPEDPYLEEEIRHLIMPPYRILFTFAQGASTFCMCATWPSGRLVNRMTPIHSTIEPAHRRSDVIDAGWCLIRATSAHSII